MKKKDFLLLAVILVVALSARLYKINTPLADLHSWRQADTASVARHFVRDGFDLLNPKYDDLSNIQSGLENPQGYRYVEFPLYNAAVAAFYKALPILPLEVWGRIITIFFSLLVICVLYYLLLKEVGRMAAAAGALVFAIFPFFVFFSRVVLPDMMAVACAFLSLFFLYLFTKTQRKSSLVIWYLCAIVFFSAGLLVKPTVIFFALAALFLFTRKYQLDVLKKIHVYVFFLAAAAPLVWWRYFILLHPEGIPVSDWLLTMVNTPQGRLSIFFRPAFFRWIFFERINNLILGGWGAAFFLLGVLVRAKKYFFPALLVSSLLYLFTFQGGNVQHEYYQVLILPILAAYVGIGIAKLLEGNKQFVSVALAYPVVIALLALSLYFSFYTVKSYYEYPKDLNRIANVISSITSPSDKIITDTIGDTTLLYLADRRGSPAPFKPFEDLKKDGYTYFVTLNRDVIEGMKSEKKYELVFEDQKNFAIFKL